MTKKKKVTLVNLSTSTAHKERAALARKKAMSKKKKKSYKTANAASIEKQWRDGWFGK
ncbi:MAG: hypothetical protein GOVbin4296_29 [Prokaryotic dsDNA virus sp.]|nr:MAG: hypothetical protein GOVbin4296_29 [Prokaryotic dsDNA virus sp.]|tara:strand:+ start:1418 stop:1591 length:174 start_codon:yes stop_codon:yes gene_type:complete